VNPDDRIGSDEFARRLSALSALTPSTAEALGKMGEAAARLSMDMTSPVSETTSGQALAIIIQEIKSQALVSDEAVLASAGDWLTRITNEITAIINGSKEL
jgi:hypothetical protein